MGVCTLGKILGFIIGLYKVISGAIIDDLMLFLTFKEGLLYGNLHNNGDCGRWSRRILGGSSPTGLNLLAILSLITVIRDIE